MTPPKISIITPSFNQAHFLGATIESVLSQDYPNLEYIIIDGGSNDGSVDIIKQYKNKISYWISEADRGQAHAINKGLSMASGSIIAWLNSDDQYEKNTFKTIVKYSAQLNGPYFITGQTQFIRNNTIVWKPSNSGDKDLKKLEYNQIDLLKCWENSLAQPSTFWSKSTFEQLGYLNENLYFALDLEYWLRGIQNRIPFYHCNNILSDFNYHDNSKSVRDQEILMRELNSLSFLYLKEDDQIQFQKSLKRYINGLKILYEARSLSEDNPKMARKLAVKASLNDPYLIIKYFSIYRSLIYRALLNK